MFYLFNSHSRETDGHMYTVVIGGPCASSIIDTMIQSKTE